MPNIAIVDDETLMRDFLEEICLEYFKDRELMVECFQNGTLLLESKNRYDLIFLDIELGIDNGIEVAKKLRQKDRQVQIIIVSGYEKYKRVAYGIHCFDYLDKPVTKEKILSILQEYESYTTSRQEEDYILIKTLQGISKIYVASIRYIEYKERKVFIYTTTDTYSLYGKMCDIYEELRDKGFGVNHRAYIVNFRKVSLIQGRDILLEGGISLPLSKTKKEVFLEQFTKFLK